MRMQNNPVLPVCTGICIRTNLQITGKSLAGGVAGYPRVGVKSVVDGFSVPPVPAD